ARRPASERGAGARRSSLVGSWIDRCLIPRVLDPVVTMAPVEEVLPMGAELLLESMSVRSRQVLEASLPVHEVVGDATGDAHGLLDSTRYATVAYAMWAEISDLYDGSSPDDE